MPRVGQGAGDRAEAHYKWARRYAESGDYGKAAAHFGRALDYRALDSRFGVAGNGAYMLPDAALSSEVSKLGEGNAALALNVAELLGAAADDFAKKARLLTFVTEDEYANLEWEVFDRRGGLLLLYGRDEATQPVLGDHLLRFMSFNGSSVDDPTKWYVGRGYLHEEQKPAYLEPREFEERAMRGNAKQSAYFNGLTPPVRAGCPRLLTVDVVDEIRRSISDVREIWLQFSPRGPFFVVVNADREYDCVFGTEKHYSAFEKEDPQSDATGVRYVYAPGLVGEEPGPHRCTHEERATYPHALLRDVYESEKLTREGTRHLLARGAGCVPDRDGRVRCDECRSRLERRDARLYYLRRTTLRASAPLFVSTYALRALALDGVGTGGLAGGSAAEEGRAAKRVRTAPLGPA
jgi:hypothetical protein